MLLFIMLFIIIIWGNNMAQTKKVLFESFKCLLLEKPFSKITIKDITEKSNINRMTFYYHFKDVYDLVEWGCLYEAQKVINKSEIGYDNWQDALMKAFELLLENKAFVMNVFHSVSQEYIVLILSKLNKGVITQVVNAQCIDHISDKDKNFIIQFYSYAIIGVLLDWINEDMIEDPKDIIERLCKLIEGQLVRALPNFAN